MTLRRTLYHAYLRSPAWQRKVGAVKRKAGYRCHDCGAGGRLEVHHKTYVRIFRERLSDLVALCPRCHKRRHTMTEKHCPRCGYRMVERHDARYDSRQPSRSPQKQSAGCLEPTLYLAVLLIVSIAVYALIAGN
jgi:rRNA maturation protein Nop10